jgi:hypothetical protein
MRRKRNKTCPHEIIETWYGGGSAKARCDDCGEAGTETRLRREHNERAPEMAQRTRAEIEEKKCSLGERCPHGGNRAGCTLYEHRSLQYPDSGPDVEFLKDGKWEPVSVNPGSRYSPHLTWKALRESGAFA